MNLTRTRFVSIAIFSVMPPSGIAEKTFATATAGMLCPNGTLTMWTADLRPLISIAICCLSLLSASLAFADDPSIELRHLGFVRDKHWNEHVFWMQLSNHSNKPYWFILPWSGNRPLSEKTIFPNDKSLEEPLNPMVFSDKENGMAVTGVSFGSTFRAFQLPARTVLEIPQYNISSKAEFRDGEIVVMEAEELLVNGKVPLEKWLPFQVGVFKHKTPGAGEVGTPGTTDPFSNAANVKKPNSEVEYVEAKGVRRWIVKFQSKGEFDMEQRNRVDLNSPACHIHLDSPGSGQSKPSADRIQQIDGMIDAMTSRNKAPRMIHVSGYDTVAPLVSGDYDWSEQDRVQKAIEAVREDKSDEMWWRLYEHGIVEYGKDQRYVMTLVFDTVVNAKNISVGDVCAAIAGPNLEAAYDKWLPKVSGRMPSSFCPAIVFDKDKKKWVGRPFYEIQVAVGEEAIRQMVSLKATESVPGNDYRAESPSHTFTSEEKAKFTEAVGKQIEELKRTKKAARAEGSLSIYSSAWEPLDARNARNVREAYEKEK